jgi:hypothetical protein
MEPLPQSRHSTTIKPIRDPNQQSQVLRICVLRPTEQDTCSARIGMFRKSSSAVMCAGFFQEQPMHLEALCALRRSTLIRFVATTLLLTLAACSHVSDVSKPTPEKSAPRAQLSIGYSLLYQEADGIPKLKWIFMFKDKAEEIGRVTNDLVSYYQQLADTMQRLSKQYPGMRIDVAAMSEIESDERKAIGADLAKDFAPLIGKTGVEFEREALLMFYNSLNEQRHLTGVMAGLETDPALRKFLETTKAQLEARYAKVEALLKRRYFTQ